MVIAAIRSTTGASAALMLLVLQGKAAIVLSVALALEYEAVCMRSEHVDAANATRREVMNFIDVVIETAERVEVHYQWRPQLPDAADEMVLEAAIRFLTRPSGEPPLAGDELPT